MKEVKIDVKIVLAWVLQARRNEKNSGESYELWNIVGHHGWLSKKFFHFKSSRTARKTNICSNAISIINRCLLRNSLEPDLKVSKFLRFIEVSSLRLKS